MRKKTIAAVFLAIILALWGVKKYRSKPAAGAWPEIWVSASPVKESMLPLEAKAMGNLVARSVEITPEVSGHVKDIFFKDGTYIVKGSPLIQLDDAIYKTKYELAKAKLSYSKMNFDRTQLLSKKGVLSKQALEQAEAELKEKQADAKENAVMLSKMKLTAPFSGQIGKTKVNPGDYVTIGQALVPLADTKHLRVEYHLSEKELSSLKLGQPVIITTMAYPGERFFGTVAFISPTVTTDNRSILLYADVPNNDGRLVPGMFVNVIQSLGSKTKALMIPARSLVPMLDGEQVFKVVNGKAYAVNVLVGQRRKEQVQVLEGLAPDDLIITDGQIKIKNGMPVKIKT